jgi:hypothetical protein
MDTSRRSIDAMLCLLNLNRLASTADILLLSAMMKNTAEMAGWLPHCRDGRVAARFDWPNLPRT